MQHESLQLELQVAPGERHSTSLEHPCPSATVPMYRSPQDAAVAAVVHRWGLSSRRHCVNSATSTEARPAPTESAAPAASNASNLSAPPRFQMSASMHSCTLPKRFDVEQCTCISQKRLWRQASQASGVLGVEPHIISSSPGSGGEGGASGITPPSIGRPPPSTTP